MHHFKNPFSGETSVSHYLPTGFSIIQTVGETSYRISGCHQQYYEYVIAQPNDQNNYHQNRSYEYVIAYMNMNVIAYNI